MLFSIATALALVWTTAASPAPAAPGFTYGTYVNNFSYPNGNPFPYPNNYSPASIPGPWQALNWITFAPAGAGPGPITNAPHSPPYYAADVLPTDTPAGASNTTHTTGSFGAAYTGSRVVSFDLISTRTGCGAELNYTYQVLRGPAFCDLHFRGYKDDARKVQSASKVFQYREGLQFSSQGTPYADLAQVDFTEPGWKGVRKVSVEAVLVPNPQFGGEPYRSAPSIALDDVEYRVKNATKA